LTLNSYINAGEQKKGERAYIKDIVQNQDVSGYFSVKYKHPVMEYKNGFRFRIGISDKSGEIDVHFWGGGNKEDVTKIYDSFKISDVVFISGVAGEFNRKLKIDVNQGFGNIRKASEQEYDVSEFIARTNQSIDEMFEYILKINKSLVNSYIKSLLDEFFNDQEFAREFKSAPGAIYYHHACIGGLLEHTWGVVRVCELESVIHPSLDRDLMLAGAILHDIGKIKEFDVTTNIKVSRVGMLLGHISIAEDMIREKINKIDEFPDILSAKILHIILSHHGTKENGSPVEPQFPEAVAVYLADMIDSQVTQYIRIKKDATTEDFRTYSKHLGQIYLG